MLTLTGCKKSPGDHLGRARTALFEHNAPGALKEYRQALDMLESDDSAQAQVWRAQALKGAADVYRLELKDARQAIPVYREVVQQCPESPEALESHIVLADLLKTRNDLRGAITELAAAIARNPPQSAELTYEVAKLYFELGDYKQSALEAGQVLARFESSAYVDDAMFLRGQALAMMPERLDEALRQFQTLADRFPDSELAPHALFEMGKVHVGKGEDVEAIEVWVRALKRHPDPQVVQSQIARSRSRIAATTPVAVGSQAAAFDHNKHGGAPTVIRIAAPKTSLEAAGVSPDQAAKEDGD